MKTIEEFVDEKIDDEWADISPEYCKHLIREYATAIAEAILQDIGEVEGVHVDIDDYIK